MTTKIPTQYTMRPDNKGKKKKGRKRGQEELLCIEDWLDEQCAICFSPMREWEADPILLNEHYAMEITILSCSHHFHKGCLAKAVETSGSSISSVASVGVSATCPLCRRKITPLPADFSKIKIQRTTCRFRRPGTDPCSRPEAPNNMGFCRLHLPVLPGLTDGSAGIYCGELGNRKLLYEMRTELKKGLKELTKLRQRNTDLGGDRKKVANDAIIINCLMKKFHTFMIQNPHASQREVYGTVFRALLAVDRRA